jgi:hypothetical protein
MWLLKPCSKKPFRPAPKDHPSARASDEFRVVLVKGTRPPGAGVAGDLLEGSVVWSFSPARIAPRAR